MSSKTLKHRLLDLDLTVNELTARITERVKRAGKTDLRPSRPHVSQVLNGRLRTPYIRRAMAEVLGMSYLEAWGERDPGTDTLLTAVQTPAELRVASIRYGLTSGRTAELALSGEAPPFHASLTVYAPTGRPSRTFRGPWTVAALEGECALLRTAALVAQSIAALPAPVPAPSTTPEVGGSRVLSHA